MHVQYSKTSSQAPRAFEAQSNQNTRFDPFIVGLAYSLRNLGFLNPIRVRKVKTGFQILDGRKRLRAVEYLKAHKLLPRRLRQIPYQIVEGSEEYLTFNPGKPELWSARAFYDNVVEQKKKGRSLSAIAREFFSDEETIIEVLRLTALHPKVLSFYTENIISLRQAAALARITDAERQIRTLKVLISHADDRKATRAVARGQTLYELENGDLIILPQRRARAAA